MNNTRRNMAWYTC